MIWCPAECEVAPPAAAEDLLRRAIAANPASPALHLKRANLLFDRFDFAGAASGFEATLRLDPSVAIARLRLARCRNVLGQHKDALDVLDAAGLPPHGQRAVALEGLGRLDEAEQEYRAVLAADPADRHALRRLGKLLRGSGRAGQLLDMCEMLSARGVGHAQLLYSWGTALAVAGEEEKARAILFDPARVAHLSLPVPHGFADIGAFNAALAEEILTNPAPLSDFPPGEEANRGSSRVHSLFAGRRPELLHSLLETLQQLVSSHTRAAFGAPAGTFDPWLEARPRKARMRAWGLIQRGGDHEEWHLHRGGWLSGVYYVRVPGSVSAQRSGAGCIEFGPPTALERVLPGYVPVRRYQPREGNVILAPSHHPHRTIPTGADEYRISFAFDVVPQR